MPDELPFGSWPSPISSSLIVDASTSVGEVHVGTDDVWWSELRPHESGRVVVVRHRPGGGTVDVVPEGFSVRTRTHEYGGGAWWVHADTLFFANWSDQRLYRCDFGSAPRPLTPEPSAPCGARYADGRVTPDGRWVICVRELEGGEGEPVNEIVAVDAHDGGEPRVLVAGPDFVSFPRVSPDGVSLCWTQWNHPDMPWDSTELWVADVIDATDEIELSRRRRLAGGPGESVTQPCWASDGSLLFISDRTDWWNLYRLSASQAHEGAPGEPEPLAPMEAEVGVPQWVFDQSRYAILDDGRILCAYASDGLDHLGLISGGADEFLTLESPYTAISSVRPFGRGAVVIAASPTSEPTVVALGVDGNEVDTAVLRPTRDLGLDLAYFSSPAAVECEPSPGVTAHALLYRPTNPAVVGPPSQAPPLVVIVHGGPTSAARPQLNLTVQYWTSRGFAVVDVNYRGSTGYGRRYREALRGQWGVADVADCVAVARHLVDLGEAAPDQLAIRGGSAGGYTTLCALVFHDAFTAGASLYGVTDLEALAHDTHKFESRYLDGLVGPYPAARDRYVERSPIHHTEGLSCPLIIFQGLEDEIVPPSQAEMLVEAMRAKALPFAYLAFPGEQHGFRRAETIQRVLEAELYFYARVFGFTLADDLPPVDIENLGTI
jgi:dipeptidyl aminopeptidase/acylaminoacyl peptidase